MIRVAGGGYPPREEGGTIRALGTIPRKGTRIQGSQRRKNPLLPDLGSEAEITDPARAF